MIFITFKKETTAAIAGTPDSGTMDTVGHDHMSEKIKAAVRNLCLEGYDTFVFFNQGPFDILASKAVAELKSEFPALGSVTILEFPEPIRSPETVYTDYYTDFTICLNETAGKHGLYGELFKYIFSQTSVLILHNSDSLHDSVLRQEALDAGLGVILM